MKILAYDSETTGVPLKGVDSDDKRQPKIIQIGAALYDDEKDEIIGKLDRFIHPDGVWRYTDETWMKEAAKAENRHKIPISRLRDEGINHRDAIQQFIDLWQKADYRIGFFEGFDRKMVRIHLKTYFDDPPLAEAWLTGLAVDVMDTCHPICKLPPTERMIEFGRGNQYKTPNLVEAYQVIVGGVHDKPHGAIDDAIATLDVWKKLRADGHEMEPEKVSPFPARGPKKIQEATARRRSEAHERMISTSKGKDVF